MLADLVDADRKSIAWYACLQRVCSGTRASTVRRIDRHGVGEFRDPWRDCARCSEVRRGADTRLTRQAADAWEYTPGSWVDSQRTKREGHPFWSEREKLVTT
jgi:hypothetical protein